MLSAGTRNTLQLDLTHWVSHRLHSRAVGGGGGALPRSGSRSLRCNTDSQSLMDLVRQRKRLTEPEARYYLVQLIGACQYMHATNVIHRDLKLGNVFLDSNMDLKVGDFGLAALIEKPGDRKK